MYSYISTWSIMFPGNWELTWLTVVNHLIKNNFMQLNENEKSIKKKILVNFVDFIVSHTFHLVEKCWESIWTVKLKDCFFYLFSGNETKAGMFIKPDGTNTPKITVLELSEHYLSSCKRKDFGNRNKTTICL